MQSANIVSILFCTPFFALLRESLLFITIALGFYMHLMAIQFNIFEWLAIPGRAGDLL
jgi:hypothetical protein